MQIVKDTLRNLVLIFVGSVCVGVMGGCPLLPQSSSQVPGGHLIISICCSNDHGSNFTANGRQSQNVPVKKQGLTVLVS